MKIDKWIILFGAGGDEEDCEEDSYEEESFP